LRACLDRAASGLHPLKVLACRARVHAGLRRRDSIRRPHAEDEGEDEGEDEDEGEGEGWVRGQGQVRLRTSPRTNERMR
jgi:hypothetical protein